MSTASFRPKVPPAHARRRSCCTGRCGGVRLTTPLMVIGVEGDATTPTDHAEALYTAASGPKELIIQRHTTHYAAYDQYWEQTTPRIVEWLDTHVRPVDLVVRSTVGQSGRTPVMNGATCMSIDLRLAGGTVVTPAGKVNADVLVADGKDRRSGRRRRRGADAGRTVDVTGKLVLPGMIDVHVHTREPGFEHKEDIDTTSRQAAVGRCDDDLRDAEPRTRRRRRRRRSPTCSSATREKSIVDFNHNPAPTQDDRSSRWPRWGSGLQDLHGGRHRPHLSTSGGHGHARPRRPAAR